LYADIAPVVPMEPVLADEPFDHEDYIFQVKWDGVRILAYSGKDTLKLFNRRQKERTREFPEIIESLAYLPAGTVLDGEAISLGPDGRPSFFLALKRDQTRNAQMIAQLVKAHPVSYMVFDMLYLEGEGLVEKPLSERQRLLGEVVKESAAVHLVDSIAANGRALFEAVSREGMEGIVAKDARSRYLIGQKSPLWKKVKAWREIDAVAGGWLKREGQLRSLLVGIPDEKGLRYIGSVSSGLTGEQRSMLRAYFEAGGEHSSPFLNPPDKIGVKWAEPGIEVRVRYLEWSSDGMLRNPAVVDMRNREGWVL